VPAIGGFDSLRQCARDQDEKSTLKAGRFGRYQRIFVDRRILGQLNMCESKGYVRC